MSNLDVLYVFLKIFGSLNLLLIIAALILNPLVVFICIKSPKLRSTSTFKILVFGAVYDLISCLIWNEEDFTNSFFDLEPFNRNLFYCRWFSNFLEYTAQELVSWILVSISLDRVLSMTVKKWSKHYFNGIKPIIYCIVLTIVIVGINLNQLFTVGYSEVINGTEIIECFISYSADFDWYGLNNQIFTYFVFIVPFACLIILNVVIIYKATQFARAQQRVSIPNTTSSISAQNRSIKRKTQMSKMIVSITFLYILASLPSTVVTGYIYGTVISLDAGQMIIDIVDGIHFSYSAFNFFVLFFSNKLFAEEVKIMFSRFKRHRNSVSSSLSGSNSKDSTTNRPN